MAGLSLWPDRTPEPSPAVFAHADDPQLTAAAEKMNLGKAPDGKAVANRNDRERQNRAWKYYGSVPEVGTSTDFVAGQLRKVTLYPAVMTDGPDQFEPLTTGPLAARANMELNRLRSTDGTFGDLMHDMAVQLTVPGEGYLAGWVDPVTLIERFEVYSTDEMEWDKSKGVYTIKEAGPDYSDVTLDPEVDFAARFHRPDGRFKMRPHSGLFTVLDYCEELLILDMVMRSTGRSRMNNGFFLYPTEVELPPVVQAPGTSGPQNLQADPWLKAVLDLMTVPISDEGSALAVAPGVLGVPGDRIDQIKHLIFERKYDETVLKRIEVCRKAIATGIDLPDEVVLGIADLNHWSAWFVDQDTYDSHLEPLVSIITTGVTEAFLRVQMRDMPGAETVVVMADASGIISHPNMSKEADAALGLGGIGYQTYRRVKGYTEDDAPTEEDLLLLERVRVKVTERGTAGDVPAPDGGTTDQGAPAGASLMAAADEGRPSTARLGEQLARIDRDLMARVHAASQGVVFRALEKSGAKMRRKVQGIPALRDSTADVPNHLLCAALPADFVAANFAEGDEDDLVAPIASSYLTWVGSAQRKVRKLAGDYGEVPSDFETKQDESRRAGLATLTALLGGVVASHLLPSGITETKGEFDPNALVQMGIVRESLSVAGGHPVGPLVDTETNQPDGAVATGLDAMSLFAQLDITPSSWTWTYTGSAPTPFEGHEQLDGVEFLDWQDDALRTQAGDEWIGEFYSVGDHRGCACDFVPTMSDGSPESGD